ncbi:MAG: GNAT family N-acetyltransferase [Anaerolineaceae bacterium]
MEIKLEPFGLEDIPRLIEWVSTAEFLMQWSGPYFTHPLDQRQLENYLNSVQKNPLNRAIFRVRELDQGQIIGHIELNNIDWRNMAASVSKVLIGPDDFRGLGIGQKMMAELLNYAFGNLKLHRVDLKVFDDNHSAIQCYQQNGFVIEGHLRDFRKFGDTYKSSFLMSILETDWYRQKEALVKKEVNNE